MMRMYVPFGVPTDEHNLGFVIIAPSASNSIVVVACIHFGRYIECDDCVRCS